MVHAGLSITAQDVCLKEVPAQSVIAGLIPDWQTNFHMFDNGHKSSRQFSTIRGGRASQNK